jgi:outer membrane protein assembly factor BamB
MKPAGGKIQIGAVMIAGVVAFAMLAVAALTVSHAQLATSPWPMFHHDLRHTGLSPYDTSANDGTQKWAFGTCNNYTTNSSSPAIGADGTIYFDDEVENVSGDTAGGFTGNLYAINPDGTQKWKFAAAIESLDHAASSTPAIGTDGTIYVGYDDGNLYAVKPNGKQKWKVSTGYEIEWSSPAIGSDGTIYFGAFLYLYAVDPNGNLKWHFATAQQIESSPAIGSDGTVYIGSDDGGIYAVNPDGTEKWVYLTESDNPVVSSPAIGADGTIYAGSEDSNVYALTDGGQGTVTKKWAFPTDSYVVSSPAIGSDGTIYVGSEENGPSNNTLYAIEPDGTQVWTLANAGGFSSPAIGADGTIYSGSYAVNSDGTQKWTFANCAGESSSAIGADGTVYCGSGCGNIYALNGSGSATPTATLSPTATPTAAPTPVSEKLTISPHALAFGNKVRAGTTSKPKTVTIKNAGSKKTGLAVSIEMESALPSVFAMKSKCEKTLAPGKSCKASVTFNPTDTTPQSGRLMIYDNVIGAPQTVGLSGTGMAPK